MKFTNFSSALHYANGKTKQKMNYTWKLLISGAILFMQPTPQIAMEKFCDGSIAT